MVRSRPYRYFFQIPHIGKYLIRDGREITVDALDEACPTDIRLYLMGSVFGAVFHQKGLERMGEWDL